MVNFQFSVFLPEFQEAINQFNFHPMIMKFCGEPYLYVINTTQESNWQNHKNFTHVILGFLKGAKRGKNQGFQRENHTLFCAAQFLILGLLFGWICVSVGVFKTVEKTVEKNPINFGRFSSKRRGKRVEFYLVFDQNPCWILCCLLVDFCLLFWCVLGEKISERKRERCCQKLREERKVKEGLKIPRVSF